MDFDCKYIDKKGLCNSPLRKKTEYPLGCFCSNYKQCFYFPESEKQETIKPERESSLEKETKE